jgi:hypothetical protein
MILTALSAGAVAALQETAAAGVKDAYQGLKALLQRKFATQPNSIDHLEEHAKDPETWEKPLAKDLKSISGDQDEQILEAAKHLLELLESPTGGGKFDVHISDAQGIVVGDHSQVEMNFGEKPKKKS